MQPTILNKVVSLFLIGGLVVLGIATIVWRHFGPLKLSSDLAGLLSSLGDNTLAVLGGLLGISLAAVCGAAFESLTDITVRPLVKRVGKNEKWSRFFRQTGSFDYHNFWRAQFKRAVLGHSAYGEFPRDQSDHGLAVGILYGSKQSEAIAWAESHYATYVMASNLALVSAIFLVYVVVLTVSRWCTLASGLSWIGVSLILLYTLFSLSLDRYLYSYLVAFRQSVVAAAQGDLDGSEALSGTAHNPRLQRTADASR